MEILFEKQPFSRRLKSMLKVDFKRMFTMALVYIMIGVCLILPILILVMTTMMGGTTVDPVTGEEKMVETFTNVWQSFGSVSGSAMSMDLTSMCNINMLYFLVAVFACVFITDDFRSGYAKNLFTIRSKKLDYVFSKTLVSFVGAAILFLVYFLGAMLGGAIAGLSFEMVGFSAGEIVACFISKICITAIFVAIALLLSVVAKQRLWLSILGSFAVGMLLFTMIPMITPLNSSFFNVILCFTGGALFSIGLGAISNVILNKTNLV